MNRVFGLIGRLVALPIFLMAIGGGYELASEDEGASPDESWPCEGPRKDLSLRARAHPLDGRMRIDLKFENETEFPVSLISLGRGGRYEWGNDPEEPPPIKHSVVAPEGWHARLSRQFEGVMMFIYWRTTDRGHFVAPGGRLEGLRFEMKGDTLPPSDLPFEVNAGRTGCSWSRWTLETVSGESES